MKKKLDPSDKMISLQSSTLQSLWSSLNLSLDLLINELISSVVLTHLQETVLIVHFNPSCCLSFFWMSSKGLMITPVSGQSFSSSASLELRHPWCLLLDLDFMSLHL